MEQKEMKLPESLEEAAKEYGNSHNATIYSIRSVAVEAFIAGAEWQLHKNNKRK